MDKRNENPNGERRSEEGPAPRARNRTVLLTPEMTGQVRARLTQEVAGQTAAPAAQHMDEPVSSHESQPAAHQPASDGFTPVRGRVVQAPPPPAAVRHEPAAPEVRAEPVRRPVIVPPPAPASEPAPAGGDQMVWAKMTPVCAFFVSFDRDPAGEVFTLRSGRFSVTCQNTGGSYLLLADASVSPMHAIVRVSESGEVQVLDQLSEAGTIIVRGATGEELRLSGDKQSLEHGDIVKFGDRSFHVCIVSRPAV